MSLKSAGIVLSIAILLAVAGCCREPMPTTMVSLETLVNEYNANAARVPRLWALAKVEISVPVAGLDYQAWGSTSRPDPNAHLLLFKGENRVGPQNFVLIGNELDMQVFRIGCSIEDGAYYFWHRFGEDASLLWGRNEYAGAPGVKTLPIDPLQMLAVLGICELPSDLTKPPAVALTMNTTPCEYAYVLTYLDRQPVTNKLLFRREIHFKWDNDKPRRPFRVDFFDARGLRVMHAELRDYKPIEVIDAPENATAPFMPTDITIKWESYRREGDTIKKNRGASVHIVLSEMQVNPHKGYPEVCKLWDRLPDQIRRWVQVDRGVEDRKGAQ